MTTDVAAAPPKPRRPTGPPKGKGGRNPEIETGKRQIILDAIAAGMTEKDACTLAGIHFAAISRYRLWATQNGPNQQEYAKFIDQVEEAKTRLKFALVTTVTAQATKDGRLAMEVLARKYPEEWAKRYKDEVPQGAEPGLLPANFTVNFNHFLVQHGAKPMDLPQIPAGEHDIVDAEMATAPVSRVDDFAADFREFARK